MNTDVTRLLHWCVSTFFADPDSDARNDVDAPSFVEW